MRDSRQFVLFLKNGGEGTTSLKPRCTRPLISTTAFVFVRIVQSGRPVGSTAVVRAQQGWAMTVVGGMVVRVTAYLDPDDARAAAKRLAQERADG